MIKHLQNDGIDDSSSKAVARWLLIGVGMIIIQILIGGITRLTESGLSITEWKPVTGILPPMDSITWQAEFDKYKGTDQFKYVHQNFTLSEFKSIFFWEWFHRVWARMMGMVFLIGFIYFLVKKKFKKVKINADKNSARFLFEDLFQNFLKGFVFILFTVYRVFNKKPATCGFFINYR